MKKLLLIVAGVVAIIILALAWMVFGSATSFPDKSKYLYIATGKANKQAILDSIASKKILSNPSLFSFVASQMKVWEKVKPGRYKIGKGQSIFSISKMLRNNQQSPVNLVINKLRTNDDLAKIIGKNFEMEASDVALFIENADSLKAFNVDSNTLMTLVIPNTYSFYWTTPVKKILNKLKSEQEKFWEENSRTQKAQTLGFTATQVYTIASIVEEETNKQDEKGNIASVYINRYHKGMPLGADPTVKFALKDFSLKRIYNKHLQVVSPFNTYRNRGLPPGPICTPSAKTIDAVLNAPKTDYIFFVAKSDFSGYHTFTTNYADHLRVAKEYQQALDAYLLKKKNNN
jgi:UPF0755 protein